MVRRVTSLQPTERKNADSVNISRPGHLSSLTYMLSRLFMPHIPVLALQDCRPSYWVDIHNRPYFPVQPLPYRHPIACSDVILTVDALSPLWSLRTRCERFQCMYLGPSQSLIHVPINRPSFDASDSETVLHFLLPRHQFSLRVGWRV